MLRLLNYLLMMMAAVLFALQSSAGSADQSYLNQTLAHIKSMSLEQREREFASEILRKYSTAADKTYFEKIQGSLAQMDQIQVRETPEGSIIVSAPGIKDIVVNHIDLRNAKLQINGHVFSMLSGHSLQQDVTELEKVIQGTTKTSLLEILIPKAQAQVLVVAGTVIAVIGVMWAVIYFGAKNANPRAKIQRIKERLSTLLKDCQSWDPKSEYYKSPLYTKYADLKTDTGTTDHTEEILPPMDCKTYSTKRYLKYYNEAKANGKLEMLDITEAEIESICNLAVPAVQCMQNVEKTAASQKHNPYTLNGLLQIFSSPAQ